MKNLCLVATLAATLGGGTIEMSSAQSTPQAGDDSPAVKASVSEPSNIAATGKANHAANRKLENAVRKAIKGGGVDASDLNVVARSGTVTLTGSVADGDQIDLASQRAQSVDGVAAVVNRLVTKGTGN
ncbi:hypothetical protein LMG27952_05080 [Paraburkholderia hiiakae]|uniref:BON domain-containing protein n=2 Tax=Paraburkholderia hiiakae TaxID=1081782 RepID=A0ABM8NZM6_9BURK|nr:hypothetical protein LMG27952_05080 [Paraburkholderia hiiakae]